MLKLRSAQGHRPGDWGPDDYDVLDGDRDLGRIFKDANETWFWDVSFMLTHPNSAGQAMAAPAHLLGLGQTRVGPKRSVLAREAKAGRQNLGPC